MNRIGDNIVVFNFIQPDVAGDILRMMLRNVERSVEKEHSVSLKIGERAEARLLDVCRKDLSLGGRAIGNVIESLLINPLARTLFDTPLAAGSTLTVNDLEEAEGLHRVVVSCA